MTDTALVRHQFAGIPCAPADMRPAFLKMLIYGKPGAGKTHLAATAARVPEMCPILYLTPDSAEADTLRNIAPEITHMPVTQWATFGAVQSELARECYNTATGPTFKTVVIDTGTETQKLSMTEIMTNLAKTGRAGGGTVDVDIPSEREWGKSINQVRTVTRGFRDLPINFIMCCHEAEKRENNGVMWRRPDLPGKLANQIAGMFSTVVYIYTKDKKEGQTTVGQQRLLLTGLTEGYVAKSRVDALPRVMQEPTMSEIYTLITQNGSK